VQSKKLRNFFMTSHEKEVKRDYQKQKYEVYYSRRLFGGMNGLPDFWITTTKYKRRLKGITFFGASAFITQDKGGFFVECKDIGGHFTPRQTRMFSLLSSAGYPVIVHRRGQPTATWTTVEKGLLWGYPIPNKPRGEHQLQCLNTRATSI